MARRAAALVLLAVIALASAGVAYWVVWGGAAGVDQLERRAQLPTSRSSEQTGAPEIPKDGPSVSGALRAPQMVPSSDAGALRSAENTPPNLGEKLRPAEPKSVPASGLLEKGPSGPSKTPIVTVPRYVRLEPDGIAVFTADPANGGEMCTKKALDTSRLSPDEIRRLTTGFAVASEAEALSLIEGLSGTAD